MIVNAPRYQNKPESRGRKQVLTHQINKGLGRKSKTEPCKPTTELLVYSKRTPETREKYTLQLYKTELFDIAHYIKQNYLILFLNTIS